MKLNIAIFIAVSISAAKGSGVVLSSDAREETLGVGMPNAAIPVDALEKAKEFITLAELKKRNRDLEDIVKKSALRIDKLEEIIKVPGDGYLEDRLVSVENLVGAMDEKVLKRMRGPPKSVRDEAHRGDDGPVENSADRPMLRASTGVSLVVGDWCTLSKINKAGSIHLTDYRTTDSRSCKNCPTSDRVDNLALIEPRFYDSVYKKEHEVLYEYWTWCT
mmetsp:Transcript_29741/g.63172  ORF Transcript_29741/g.63172 Transcript_29741/m.63172 type:complete len:219 (-) Transcript_29741:68-724(-)